MSLGAIGAGQPQKRTAPAANPLSIAPDHLWYGNDGPWSTFLLGYGTPVQYVHSYISTSTTQPYVVLSQGCTPEDPHNCTSARGGIFYPNASSSWQNLGVFTLTFEQNLGIYQNGQFGLDSITLPGSNAVTMDDQTVVGIATKDFFLGTWGIRPAPTYLISLNDSTPSLLQNLKDGGKIPSLSWAYTAGAYYQSQSNNTSQGSLTIGGYDASRLQENNAVFNFSSDTSRDLQVAVHAIVTAGGSNSLLSQPIMSFIDSAVSHIWLPLEACQAFEQTFNLTYDEGLDLYLVNDSVHETLVAQNASISFTLSNNITLNPSIDSLVTIDLPYSAFDLQLTADYPNNTKNATHYFPVRQAANSSQYTLGRAFLQEAYVIADYERSQFSVYQAVFPDASVPQNLQTIQPWNGNSNTTSTAASSQSPLSTGALIGIIVAAVVVLLGICGGGGYLAYRKRKRRRRQQRATVAELEAEEKKRVRNMQELNGKDASRVELSSPDEPRRKPGELVAREISTELESPEGIYPRRNELGAEEVARELDAAGDKRRVFEMPG